MADRSRTFNIMRSIGIFDFNEPIHNLICTVSDLAISLNKNTPNYFMYSSLFPNSISSVENVIIYFQLTDFYPLICYYEPLYFLVLPNMINNLLQIHLLCKIIINHSNVIQSISLMYKNGYDTSHLPSLSGFWYLMMCMVEQYSSFSYTLILIYSNYLIKKRHGLLPIFKGSSTFTSYLPMISNSKMIDLYCIFGLIFEYTYNGFKSTMVFNTNFIYWSTLLFIILYILDLKLGRCNIKSK